jgi:hypothetical protein
MEKFNDRIDFLWRTLGYKSARSFDRALGVSEKQTAAITGVRQVMPRADYVQRIVELHPEVNANWLLIGIDEWRNPPKDFVDRLLKKIEELSIELEASKTDKGNLQIENEGLKNSVVNLALFQAGQTSNFQPVSNKTPARRRVVVFQLPLFASSVANSTWLSAL